MATTIIYWPGQGVRFTAEFKVGGVYADPTAVTFSLRDPAGKITVYPDGDPAIVKDDVGQYHADLVLDGQGEYHYRFVGTTPAAAAGEATVELEQSAFV